MFFLLVLVALVVTTFVLVRRASLRYEKEHIAAGAWDERGPLHPTFPEPWEIVSRRSLGLRLRGRVYDALDEDLPESSASSDSDAPPRNDPPHPRV